MKELIAENRSRVRSVIKKLTGNYNEDLEQEVYIKAWQSLPAGQDSGNIKAWLTVVTRNLCFDYFRSAKVRHEISGREEEDFASVSDLRPNPEEVLSAKARQKIILEAVNRLPPKMKKVIELYEFEEMSCEKISSKMNIPVGTVKSRLFSARKILSEDLKYLYQEKEKEL